VRIDASEPRFAEDEVICVEVVDVGVECISVVVASEGDGCNVGSDGGRAVGEDDGNRAAGTEGDGGGMFSDEGGGDDVSFRSTIDEDAGWVAIHSANESEKGAGDVVSLDGLKVKGSLAHVLQVSGRSRGY